MLINALNVFVCLLFPTWVSSKVYNRQSLKLVRTLWGHDDHVWSIDMNRLETLPKTQKGPCCETLG